MFFVDGFQYFDLLKVRKGTASRRAIFPLVERWVVIKIIGISVVVAWLSARENAQGTLLFSPVRFKAGNQNF
ncbi:MAG: hypothetical protein WC708_06220 [Lentisphaeria bacterium]